MWRPSNAGSKPSSSLNVISFTGLISISDNVKLVLIPFSQSARGSVRPCSEVDPLLVLSHGAKWCNPLQKRGVRGVFYIFIFFKIVFYRNIFSVSQFTGLYPYRPAGGRQAPPQYKSRGPPHLYLQQTTSIEGKRRDVGWGRELQQRNPAGFWIRTATLLDISGHSKT